MDELTLTNNLEVFESNGFNIEIDDEAPPGKKCYLKSVPLSKGISFDVKDIHELIYLIGQHPGNSNIKCSKLRAMFAMRACRSSIMIGKPLTTKIMERTVKHLSELNKPWVSKYYFSISNLLFINCVSNRIVRTGDLLCGIL